MNNMIVPPSPNWYLADIMACAPDNTLIYGSKNDLIIISDKASENPLHVQRLERGHSQKIFSIDVNIQWGSPNKWALSSGDDGMVVLWDIEKMAKITSHEAHKEHKDQIVGARFLTEERVLSVSDSGHIYIWHPSTKQFTKLSNFFQMKVKITCFSPCPHATYITAFGLKNGLIVVANLKKNGTLMHKLRGHTNELISLSWCPAPINIFPSSPNNYIRGTIPPEKHEVMARNDENNQQDHVQENKSVEISLKKDYTTNKNEESEKGKEESRLDNLHQKETETKEIGIPKNDYKLSEEKMDSVSSKEEKLNSTIKDGERVEEMPSLVSDRMSTLTIEEKTVQSGDTLLENTNNPSSKITSAICVEEEPRKEFLLASSGKESTIYIWRAGTDGRMQCFFKLPEKKSNTGRDHVWSVVKWVSQFSLLAALRKGTIINYTLPKPKDIRKQYSIVHNDHTSSVFTLAAHVPILTAENWLANIDTKFWSFGHDMLLFNTKLGSKTHLVTLETFCALILNLVQSPLDPNRICIGLSNGAIKIWNMKNFNIRNFSTVNYSLKIHSTISGLAWHPKDELIVAFSTEDGTLGYLNTSKQQKGTWFKQTFSNKVHKIEWGPHKKCKDEIGLFATGKGTLKCFNAADPKSDAFDIALPPDTDAYTFAWKLDNSLMLLISMNGKITVFNPEFTVKATYYEKKKINMLFWHPESACDSESKSYWVAAVQDSRVYIYDFAELATKNGVLDIENVPKIVLDGHKNSIRSLAWSPFDGNKLVTAAEDGLTHVWNCASREKLATFYTENFEPVKSILWSADQEDVLMCSTSTATLIFWKVSDYPAQLCEEVLAKYESNVKNEKRNVPVKENDALSKNVKKIKKSIKNTILPNLNCGHDSTEEMMKLLREILESKEKNDLSDAVPSIKHLFNGRDDVLSLLNNHEASHIEKGKYEAASMVSFWKGDLQDSIKEAIEQRRVTVLLISLASSVSVGLWQKACETYANQLEEREDSDPLEIATYFVASQNIEKAVTSLCEREMFKEALVLSKLRFPNGSVFVNDVLEKWASFSTYHGSLETAAQCYIALGKYEEAAKVLFRRSEVEVLNFALELAKQTENDELIKAIEFRCKAFANDSGDGKNNQDNDRKMEDPQSETTCESKNTKDQIETVKYDKNLIEMKIKLNIAVEDSEQSSNTSVIDEQGESTST